jgi:hypothetical protein
MRTTGKPAAAAGREKEACIQMQRRPTYQHASGCVCTAYKANQNDNGDSKGPDALHTGFVVVSEDTDCCFFLLQLNWYAEAEFRFVN